MKVLRFALPTVVLGAALVASMPRTSIGFSLLGITINADRSGFQVNPTSWPQASANNNLVGDANFPGATGAALSCWKASAEWAADLRANNGNGDLAQPGG